MTKERIVQELRNRKRELANRFGVKRLALFGSFARDENTEKSDIDLWVEMEPSAEKFFALQSYLEKLFDHPVDLGTKLRRYVAKKTQNEMIFI